MPPRDLTASDISDWPTPGQAAQLLIAAYNAKNGYAAKATLLGRLRGGMVQAVSDHSVIGGRNGTRETIFIIPADDWLQANEVDLFWVSGDFEFKFVDEESTFRSMAITRHYGVKFEPQGVQDIIKSVVRTSSAQQDEAQPETRGARLPDAHFAAWFEFYAKIGGEMREDPALAHIQMCFPKNSVSRQRIREVIGPRPMGRPKKNET